MSALRQRTRGCEARRHPGAGAAAPSTRAHRGRHPCEVPCGTCPRDQIIQLYGQGQSDLSDVCRVVLDGFGRAVQLDNYSCGAQSAFMILRYFGKARSIERTIKLLGTDADGTGIQAMTRLFRARRLAPRRIADGTKQDIRRAIDDGHPVLVLLDDEEHWACMYGYGKGRVYLADPLPHSLRVVVSWPDFRKRWVGKGAAVSRVRKNKNEREVNNE